MRNLHNPFGVKINGELAQEYKKTDKLGLEIKIEAPIFQFGLVPEYEVFDVMNRCGYNISDWKILKPEEKGQAVAFIRIKDAIEAYSSDKQDKKSRKK